MVMNRKISLLLPLCVIAAVLLNVYAAADPTGVYRKYLKKLDPMTPPVAAMAMALSDGVYPWSKAPAPAVTPTPKPQPEPVPDPDPEPIPEPEPVPDLEPIPQPTPAPPSDGEFTTVDAGYFDDALFIGDSLTDGFRAYAGLPNAAYLCHNGINVWSAAEDAIFDGQTLSQALEGKHYGKIYILLGINELGTGTPESWAEGYSDLVAELRRLQPEALIFLQSIFHTTQEKSDSSIFKNSTIDARNAALSKLADRETVYYVNCNEAFDDGSGAMPAEYSGDGIHLKAAYYACWRDYLFRCGVYRWTKP